MSSPHGKTPAPPLPATSRSLFNRFSCLQAGEAVVRAVVDPDIVPGGYYDKATLKLPSAPAQDKDLQAALWEVTQNVLVSGGDLQRAVEV